MSATQPTQNLAVVRRLCEQWPWLMLTEFQQFMAPDCDYRNIPIAGDQHIGPVEAHKVLSRIREDWNVELSILNIVANDDRVLTERNEHFVHHEGKKPDFHLPVMGVFELRDGKITAWRDYFELSQMKLAY